MSDALPTNLTEARSRGWQQIDVVFVSGDAYVDHPSFAAALLGRVLESVGYRVGILSQPDWKNIESFRALGKPSLFYAITGGNVDSMLAHYTPRRRKRHDDPYSPGGKAGGRPDRATVIYAQRCREAYKNVPIVIGGIEASLRRLAHWDHWSRTVHPSILVPSKADLLVYGMGEKKIVEIAHILAQGGSVRDLRELRSVCFMLGKKDNAVPEKAHVLPSTQECIEDPSLIAEVTKKVCQSSRQSADFDIVQRHKDQLVVHRPKDAPPTTEELDQWYSLPFTRVEHPSLKQKVPALDTVRWSVITHRGCFGGCSFCALAEHQGRTIISRSQDSILEEIGKLVDLPNFSGVITDLGGPSANMYGLSCGRDRESKPCKRRSCLWPKICPELNDSPGPWLELLESVREIRSIHNVRISSGVRMDLLLKHPKALEDLARYHVGGQLKVAPEHDGKRTLRAMRKYGPGILGQFKRVFDQIKSHKGSKQYLVAYLMSGHPDSTPEEMASLVNELKSLGLRPRQVQDFTPTPMTISTAQHVSGSDPLDGRVIVPVRGDRARRDQRVMLQWFLPENQERARRLLKKVRKSPRKKR